MQINIKLSYRLILLILVDMARHAQITQNNKFAKSLWYLKKELSYEVDVLYADKHESLLQVDTIFYEVGQACLSTRTSLKCLCDVLRKKLRMS